MRAAYGATCGCDRHFVGHGGDYYFKDWHAERAQTTGLLLQKAAHDLDVIHYLAGGYSRRVTALGGLSLYGQVTAEGGHGGADPRIVAEFLRYVREGAETVTDPFAAREAVAAGYAATLSLRAGGVPVDIAPPPAPEASRRA